MFLFSGAFDCGDRLSELKPDGAVAPDGSEILEEFSILQEIGTESHGDDGDAGIFGKFDSDGVEKGFIECGGSGGLGKDNDGTSLRQSFFSFLHDCLEVVARVGPIHCDAVETPHDVAEKRDLEKRAFDDKTEVASWAHEGMDDGGFEEAHVVSDNDSGPVDLGEIVKTPQVKYAAAAFRDANIVIGIQGLQSCSKVAVFGLVSGTAEDKEISEVEGESASEHEYVDETAWMAGRCIVGTIREGIGSINVV